MGLFVQYKKRFSDPRKLFLADRKVSWKKVHKTNFAMGAGESSISDFRVTDAKTMVKHKCLQRKDYLDIQSRAALPSGDPFGANNVYPFLDRNIVKNLVPYLLGPSLSNCMSVCPLWFVSFMQGVDDICAEIDGGFSKEYGKALEFEYARTDWSPVHTEGGGMRADRVIVAKVKQQFVGRSLNISYSHNAQKRKLNSAKKKDYDRHHVMYSYFCRIHFQMFICNEQQFCQSNKVEIYEKYFV